MKMADSSKVTTDDTRYLLPSEIARLVYGYLKQNRCDEVAEKFLNTSPHMKECLEMRNKRCKFMTKAHGLTLEEISNQCLKMNKMLLKAVNRELHQSRKFHDPVEALKFVIDPNSVRNCSLVNEEPLTIDDDASSDICLDLNLSPDRSEEAVAKGLSDSNIWSESTCRDFGIDNTRKDTCSRNFEGRPSRNLDQNAVLNKSGKVKVLRPRQSATVAGKTMPRFEEPNDQTASSNGPTDGEPASEDLRPRSPESPLREEHLDGAPASSFESPLLETPSFENRLLETPSKAATDSSALTPQPTSESAKGTEDSTASSRSRRNRKKSSGSWNTEQMPSSKSSSSKIVPEIEVGHMLIQQTLIKNPKIHERIAENINKAISESPQKKMTSDLIDELNTTVKKVADETMNDPLCKDIIDELLGSLTNVNLCFENETSDMDESNLSFPDKFYENVAANGSNFQSGETVGSNLPVNETDSNYQNLEEYVSISSQQQQQQETEIIFAGEMAENGGNQVANQNYQGAADQSGVISGCDANVDIRSYFTGTSDIKETGDNVETIDGTVINVLEPACSNLIPVHGVEPSTQYCIASTVPVFVGTTTTATTTPVAAVAANAKKRSARIQQCVFPTTRVTRRLTPIAPKPIATGDVENKSASVISRNINSRRPAKKMKK